jgi:Predicted transcriptional regulator
MEQSRRGDGPTREATADEHKAVANATRLRILRLCSAGSQTNKELADTLGIAPATCLRHVRILVNTGFLAPDDVRTGRRGALERPYRSTGKTWLVTDPPGEAEAQSLTASIDALRHEIGAAPPGAYVAGVRLGLTLTDEHAAQLGKELDALIDRYARLEPDDHGTPHGLFILLHQQPPTR